MLELHNIAIDPLFHDLSLTVDDAQAGCLTAFPHAGKTTLLRAILGMLPVSAGHICIDGELLTMQSAPYFRRMVAYVPQQLPVLYGYDTVGELLQQWFGLEVNRSQRHHARYDNSRRWSTLTEAERYLTLVSHAAMLGKRLVLIDEPATPLDATAKETVAKALHDMAARGATVLAIGSYEGFNTFRL